MADWFTFVRPEFDGHVVRIVFFRGRPPARTREPDERQRVGTLQVAYRHADGNPAEEAPTLYHAARFSARYRIPDPVVEGVALELVEGITPSVLQRFAWARWFRVAETIARAGSPLHVSEAAQREMRRALKLPVEPQRPGRRGHEPDFYEPILRRHRQLREDGRVKNATKALADELNYSPNTVAGWIRRGRQLFPDLDPPTQREN